MKRMNRAVASVQHDNHVRVYRRIRTAVVMYTSFRALAGPMHAAITAAYDGTHGAPWASSKMSVFTADTVRVYMVDHSQE